MKNLCLLLTAAVCFVAAPAVADAQGGTVTGTVTDQSTRQPIAGARVAIGGTSRQTITSHEGRYSITAVEPGTYVVRASYIGYAQGMQQVTVSAGQTVTATFALSQSALTLEQVVVTATGREERRRELGASVAQLNVEEVEMAAVPNMSSLLTGRAAGVSVLQSGGTVGSGSRIRIRGSNSVSLSNEPLIIVDGVRYNNTAASLTVATGGQSPSRLNDLNPEDIESVEIIKGPAAAALYGTAAANGVIQVATKRGRAGRTRWGTYTEYGRILERTDYADNAIDEDWCTVFDQAEGACEAGVLHRDNPFHDPELRPFVDGHREKVGLNASGGTEMATYYLSGETDQEQGVFGINKTRRNNLRANLNSRLSDRLSVGVRTGYSNAVLAMQQNDNNFGGVHLNGNLGYPRSHPDGSTGWYWQTPAQVFSNESEQEISRFTAGMNANYQATSWLSLVGTAGMDRLDRHDNQFVEPGISDISVNNFAGTRTSNRIEIANITSTFDATGRFALTPTLLSTSSLGVQYNREEYHDTRGFGVGVVPGTRSLGGTTRQYAVGENTTENATFGAYVSQQLGYSDRLFVTAALRGDKNSAFGTDIGWVGYPSISASWIVSDEEFFPRTPFTSFRLRSSYGRSGLRPSFRDAATFYDPAPVRSAGGEQPGITLSGAGNPELKPEISSEFEVGFDAGLLGDRFGLDFTYYNKQSKDALIRRRLAPSIGAVTTRFENIGNVSNIGFEALLNAHLFQRDQFAWDALVSYGQTKNKLKQLGEGVEPIIFGLGGNTQRHTEGYPLGGYWQKPMSWTDSNSDGLVQFDEVTEGPDFEYMGTPFPTREASLQSTMTFFNLVRVSGLLDYKGGHKLYNFTRGDRCAWEMVCEETYNAAVATPSDQLGWIGFNLLNRNVSEFIESADFVKLRELSFSFLVPDRYLRQLRVNGARFTLSGRNLALWTDYRGYDPEVNTFGQDNFSTADYHNQPPVRYYTMRLDFNF